MDFDEVLAELRRLSFEERQFLIRVALELESASLPEAEKELVEARLAEHHNNPDSSVPLQEFKKRLQSR